MKTNSYKSTILFGKYGGSKQNHQIDCSGENSLCWDPILRVPHLRFDRTTSAPWWSASSQQKRCNEGGLCKPPGFFFISAGCMKMPPIWDVYLLVIFRGPSNGSILNGLGLSSFPVSLPSLEEDALGHLPAFTRKVVDCHFHQITASILGGTEGYDHGGIALKIKQTTHETSKCSGN